MKKYIIVAGAGISVAPPSNLPSWWEYNKKLIEQIKMGALKLCPEATDILDSINVESKLPVQCISQLVVSQGAGESYFPLLELLDGTDPNANHFALAELARQEKIEAVITTNFDTLIEAAFRKEAVPLYTVVHGSEYYEAAGISACKLFKIHGTIHDHKTLIDTVNQKAIGLSAEKRRILEGVFSDREILVIGFSGADLDFDIDYIPFARALEEGGKLTWILRPGCKPNPNVVALQKKYPGKVRIQATDLSELFQTMGVDYSEIQKHLKISPSRNSTVSLNQRIAELFASEYIGTHGCVGYCLSMLEMIGDRKGAAELAKLYEMKLDWSALNIFAVLGINALAQQKMRERNWEGCIRCYKAVTQCLMRMNDLNNELQRDKKIVLSSEQKKKQETELAQNLAAAYQNLGITYYYMAVLEGTDTLKSAEEMLELAKMIIQQKPDIPLHSMVTFNLGRVKYKSSRDYDQYLNTLRISQEYAKKEGRLDALAEILHEECAVRMMIGEYFLVAEALSFSEKALKNVGRTALTQQWNRLNKQYQLRTGDHACSFTEPLIQWLQKDVDDPVRKMIIALEAKKQKNAIAPLFSQLCNCYLENKNWPRLLDLALCYRDAACTEVQQSDALYMLGCAMMEQSSYAAAEEYFTQIINMGKSADQLKLGWAHSELCRICIKKHDMHQAMHHFNECLRVLQEYGDKEQLVHAGVNCVQAFFSDRFFDDAESCAADLLIAIDKSDVEDVKDYLDHLRKVNKPVLVGELQNQSPQVIAEQANRLHRDGCIKQAWEWMFVSKERYLESGDMEGVGHCENNMAGWCWTEGNYDGAAEHFKAAIEIKLSLADMGGVANQIAALLQLHVQQDNREKAEKVACYAEQNMPLFLQVKERYTLYYSLFRYKCFVGDYASALDYGEKAEDGIKYLTDVSSNAIEYLVHILSLLRSTFTQRPPQNAITEFEKEILEATRLYKSGKLGDSLAVIGRLKNQCGEDLMKKGVAEGTCANAYLYHNRYADAIERFKQAIHLFEALDGEQQEEGLQHRLTAINGMAIALGYLGKDTEALELFRRELGRENLPHKSRCSLTINLCNRLIMVHKDSLEKGDAVFTEVQDMLDTLSALGRWNHEEMGGIYCVYGALYMVTEDNKMSKQYYQKAKNEFLIINSPHIETVEQVLKLLEDD